MPVPRHFSQRPRRGLRPPPHRNQAPEEAAPVIEAAPVEVEDSVREVDAFLDSLGGPVTPSVESPDEPLNPPSVASGPAWSMVMKKSELLAIAAGFGITVPDEATKAQIITLLDAHSTV